MDTYVATLEVVKIDEDGNQSDTESHQYERDSYEAAVNSVRVGLLNAAADHTANLIKQRDEAIKRATDAENDSRRQLAKAMDAQHERDALRVEHDRIALERNQLMGESASMSNEIKTLAHERNQLREDLDAERAGLTAQTRTTELVRAKLADAHATNGKLLARGLRLDLTGADETRLDDLYGVAARAVLEFGKTSDLSGSADIIDWAIGVRVALAEHIVNALGDHS